MSRPWQVWLSFAVCSMAVLVAMSWLTARSLELDRAEALAREELQQEIDIKLAVLRMDAVLSPLLAQEAAQSFVPLPGDDPFANAETQAIQSVGIRDLPSHVLLQFRSIDGQWSSPQVADLTTFEQTDAPAETVSAEAESATERLDELRHSIQLEELLAVLPEVRLESTEQLARQSDYRLDQLPLSASNAFYGRDRESPLQQDDVANSERQAKSAKVELHSNRRQLARTTAQGQQELAARNQVLQAFAASQRAPGGWGQRSQDTSSVVEGDSRALWFGDRLLYVRRISVDGAPGVSGSWLDWQEIKKLLLDQVAELVPNADLTPVNEATPDELFLPGRTLAALPVQLVLPRPRLDSMPWTPVRVSLAAVWLCLGLAAAAIGGLLWGILRLSERRAAFVAAVTHELRTPLTTFKLYSEMLAAGMVHDPQKSQSYLQTLSSESDRLIHLVENVLSYARLERGRHVGKKSATTAGAILDLCESRLTDRAREANMQLNVSADAESRQAKLTTDSAAVEQILFNLVDNACKHAQNGSTNRIQLALAANDHYVTFRVDDEGPGFSAKAQRDLFRPFSKSVEDAAQTAAGVGLGLALCHRLAVDLGGRLQLQNSPRGASLVLELPR